MTEQDPIKIEYDNHVAWLTLNRPEKRNAMNQAFFHSIKRHLKELDQDSNVRVIVIKAEGKSFTVGLDLMEAGSMVSGGASADDRETLRRKILDLQDSFNAVEQCRKPVIAAAHSHCIGGGVDLLSACDIRVASRDTIFSVREVMLAIIADLGTLQRLPYIIGEGWFRELALTGRDFTAEEALQMGFITRICEDQEDLYKQAGELAHQIAGYSPLATEGIKDVALFNRENGVYPGLQYVAQKNSVALISEDLVEAMTAFMQKRKPEFKGK